MTSRGRFALSGLGAACWVSAMVAYLMTLLSGDGWLLAVVAVAFVMPLVDLGFACVAGGLKLHRQTRAVAGLPTAVRLERTGRPRCEGDLVLTVFPPGGPVRGRVPAGADEAVLAHPAGGRGPMAPLRWMADTYGPLGLAARRRHGLDAAAGLVRPARAEPVAAALGGAVAGERRPDPYHGTGPDPAGVRGWRPGDSAHAVHWRSTARRAVPVVREWTREHGRGLVVVAGRFGPAQEPAIARAAATAAACLARGVPVTLVAAAGTTRPATVEEALDWFALLASAPAPRTPDGPVLWISADPPPTLGAAAA